MGDRSWNNRIGVDLIKIHAGESSVKVEKVSVALNDDCKRVVGNTVFKGASEMIGCTDVVKSSVFCTP